MLAGALEILQRDCRPVEEHLLREAAIRADATPRRLVVRAEGL